MQKIEINSGKEMDVLRKAAFVVTDQNLYDIYGPLLPKDTFVVPAGEGSKTLYYAEKIASELLRRGVRRTDTIAAFGGGMVGDLVGFAASVYMRGVGWSFVPTSLLAMADSSIGGKTAVNVGKIKNAVGSFWLPDTYIETKYLSTLPKSEYESGMGEIVKTSLLDGELYKLMHGEFNEVEAIKKCVCAKSEIVSRDMTDKGARKVLNMGHTVGHAIELLSGLSHGKCVLIGMRLEMLMLRDLIPHNFFYEAQSYLGRFIGNGAIDFCADDVAKIAQNDKKNGDGISIMYPCGIGDVKEAVLSGDEFTRLIKGAI
ncbi:MAG: 3-dehydroquinate synthase [Clostridia bacterium]|nr:3-dehydroquinate synthase [Clostridia bacterium]